MKGYIILLVFFFSTSFVKAQNYKITYNTGAYTMCGSVDCEVVGFAVNSSIATSGIDGVGVITLSGQPLTISVFSYYDEYDNQGDIVSSCRDEQKLTLSTNSCYTFTKTNYNTTCGGIVDFSISVEPIIAFESGTSLSGNGVTYCENENIALVATPGFTSYSWQYESAGTGWKNFTPPGTGYARTFKFTDVFSSSLLTESISFRYTVGNCNYAPAANPTGAFVFNPLPPIVLDATPVAETCFGDGGSRILIDKSDLSRQPIANETLTFSVYDSNNLGSATVLNTSTINFNPAVNPTVISPSDIAGGLPNGSYYILMEGEINANATGCKNPVFGEAIIDGPVDAITTSNAGVNQITCNSTTTLSGNTVDSDETGSWTLVSGSGTIANPSSPTTNITGLGVGNNVFQWKITQNFGCISSDNVTINRINVTNANAGINQSVCSSTTTLGGNVPGGGENGTWSLVTGSGSIINPSQNTTTITGLSEGINKFRWTIQDNGGNCSTTDDVSITYVNLSTPNAGTDQLVCPDVIVSLNANAAAAGENGVWSVVAGSGSFTNANNNTSQATGLSVGVNTFRWTISGGGCTPKSNDVDITVSDLSVNEVTASRTNPSCFGNSDGSITVVGTGGTGLPSLDYEFTLSNGAKVYANAGQNAVFTGLPAGSYSLTTRDNSCTIPYNQTIILTNPSQISSTETLTNYNGYQISCNGASDGAISMLVSGGTGVKTYSWDSGQNTKDITNLSAGTYTVTITDANGCSKDFSYTLNEPLTLSQSSVLSNYNGKPISCNGANDGSIDIDVSGGTPPYSYAWSTGAVTQDLASLGPGVYSVLITDANNCSKAINNIILEEPDPLTLAVDTQQNVSCFGEATGQVALLSTGGSIGKQYSLDGINYQTDNTFTGLSQGAYSLYVKDVNGCSAQVTITLTEPPVLSGTITSITDATCGALNGSASVTVTGGAPGYTYTWRDANNNPVGSKAVLSAVGGGIYQVTVTDVNGCSLVKNANISSIDGPQTSVASIQPTSCFDSTDGSATLTISGNGPFDVAWQNGETGVTATNLQPGNNTVVIADANGCVAVEEISVPSPTAIEVSNIYTNQATCFDSTNGSIQVVATGGTGTYSYQWANGTTTNQLSNIGQGTYTITITDANGCKVIRDVVLPGVQPLTATVITQVPPTCQGYTDGSLEIGAAGGNGGYTYAWSNGQTTSTITALAAGVYQVTITDSLGCSLDKSFEVEEAEPFQIDPFEDTIEICTGSSYQTGYNLPNATYAWTSDIGFTSNQNIVVLNEAGNYLLTVTNEKGCVAQDGFELVVSEDLLNADFLMVTEAYVGDTVFIIDISWPVPDALTWGFANNVTVLEQGPDYAAVVFNEPDIYAVDMTVQLADCSDFYVQSINILDRSEKDSNNGRQAGNLKWITRFDVYPNPNYGNFTIDIELSDMADVQMQLIDLQRNRLVLSNTYPENMDFSISIDRSDLPAGIYLVTAKVKDEFKVHRTLIK